MSLLSELTALAKKMNLSVETGVFSNTPPDQYLVFTPVADGLTLAADDEPNAEVQEVRISLFCKGNYNALKNTLTRECLKADITVTDRRYVGHEDDTGFFHYAIDVAKNYDWRNE